MRDKSKDLLYDRCRFDVRHKMEVEEGLRQVDAGEAVEYQEGMYREGAD